MKVWEIIVYCIYCIFWGAKHCKSEYYKYTINLSIVYLLKSTNFSIFAIIFKPFLV